MSDEELLQSYVCDGSQPAFAELVDRHLALVYSVARRHLGSTAAAEDVAQSVFLELAQQAARIKRDTPLVAWLHLVARRTAIDTIRREARRRAREQQAAALAATTSSPMPPPSSAWSEVEPLLDEAVESLAPLDRTAVLLRFFQNKSLRDVGVALGTSDDAAQKRVSRALDQLREFLVRRGVTVSAVSLAADLSAHGVGATPVALGAAIHSAALLAPTVTVGAAHTVIMTTLQKSLLATGMAAFAAVGAYHLQAAAQSDAEVEQLARVAAADHATLQRLTTEHNALQARLQDVERQIDARLTRAATSSPADPALEAQMRKWLAEIESVKAAFARNPHWSIPELELLGEDQWFSLVSQAKLDSDSAMRQMLATLRHRAENMAVQAIANGLQAYLKKHDGLLPPDLAALASFADQTLSPAILARYEVVQRGKAADLMSGERGRVIVSKAPADVELDSFWWVGAGGGFGNTSALSENINAARRAFQQRYPGQKPSTAAQLAAHLKWPMDPVRLQQVMDGAALPR